MARKIGLCLSGGGFRATLFHLGLVRCLRDRGWLSEIQYISSVSGGSILAAHMVLNWDRYSGTEEDFDRAAKELLHFVQKDVRGRIVRRFLPITIVRAVVSLVAACFGLILGKKARLYFEETKDFFTTTGLLEYYYSRLYGRACLDKLPIHGQSPARGDTNAPPELHILGSNITKATVCSFNGRGFLGSEDSPNHYGRSVIRVSQAVAASSAFPGFFPPLHLSREMISWDLSELATEHQYVADAGVSDNLGLSMFFQVKTQTDMDLVLVSDATGTVDWAIATRMRNVIGSALRTLEIITGQTTDLQKENVYRDFISMKKDWTPIYVFIEISDRDEDSPAVNQPMLKKIRTDLDRFSETEICALVQHGYALTFKTLAKLGSLECQRAGGVELNPEWPLTILGKRRESPEREHRELMRASERGMATKGFMRDWLGWVYVLIVLGVIPTMAGLAFLAVRSYAGERARQERIYSIRRFIARPPSRVEPEQYPIEKARESPDNSRFVFIDDIRYFDLREWKPPPSEVPVEPFSPVMMTREIRARKIAPQDKIRFQAQTSGTGVYVRSYREAQVSAEDQPQTVGSQAMKVLNILIDVKDVDVKGEFTLVYDATYYDAFAGPDQWWVGAKINEQPERLALIVVFPKSRPFTMLACRMAEGKKVSEIECDGLSKAADNTFAYWEIDRPRTGVIYQLKWQWTNGSR